MKAGGSQGQCSALFVPNASSRRSCRARPRSTPFQSMRCEPRAMRRERRPCAASFPLTPRERQFFAARPKFRRPSSDCDLAQSYERGQSAWLYRRSITWLCFFPGRAFSLGMAPLRVRKNDSAASPRRRRMSSSLVVAVAVLRSPAIGLRLPKVGSARRFASRTVSRRTFDTGKCFGAFVTLERLSYV